LGNDLEVLCPHRHVCPERANGVLFSICACFGRLAEGLGRGKSLDTMIGGIGDVDQTGSINRNAMWK